MDNLALFGGIFVVVIITIVFIVIILGSIWPDRPTRYSGGKCYHCGKGFAMRGEYCNHCGEEQP